MPYKDPARRREYQKAWAARRRERAITMLGGRCTVCGSTENLQVHHWVGAAKEGHRIYSWAWPRLERELAKCLLLCAACHAQADRATLARPEVVQIKRDRRPARVVAQEYGVTERAIRHIRNGTAWANVHGD